MSQCPPRRQHGPRKVHRIRLSRQMSWQSLRVATRQCPKGYHFCLSPCFSGHATVGRPWPEAIGRSSPEAVARSVGGLKRTFIIRRFSAPPRTPWLCSETAPLLEARRLQLSRPYLFSLLENTKRATLPTFEHPPLPRRRDP